LKPFLFFYPKKLGFQAGCLVDGASGLRRKLFEVYLRLAFFTLVALIGRLSIAQSEFSDADAEAIQVFLRRTFDTTSPGMVVGVLDHGGSRLFSMGKLDNGTDREIDGDTIFEIGSVTKVFTSLLALEMERRGEITLDDPVAKYLPEAVTLPIYEGRQITLRNLAAQDSGLPWNSDELEKILSRDPNKAALAEFKAACDAYTAKELYAFLSRYKLTKPPGTEFQYSNVGMGLLGHAIALKAGEPYESLIVERIARPLEMESTMITIAPAQEGRLARGHWADGKPSENIRFQVLSSAGGLLSTANDMLKFLAANLAIVQSELIPLMEKMQVVRHIGEVRFGRTAMPWFDEGMYQPPGSDLWGHGGGGFGYLAFIGFDKKKRRAVMVLSNQMAVNPSGVGWTILQGMALSRENVTYFVREIVGTGIGFDADEQTGLLRITMVYPNSPAGNAGLCAGVLIRKIDDVLVERKTLQECVGMIRGAAGTNVRLEIFDRERDETRIVELTRRKFVTSTG